MRAWPTFAFFAFLALATVNATSARAQGAWVGAERSLSASLDYNFSTSSEIVESGDIPPLDEPIVAHSITLGAEFVPVDRLAVNVAVPIMAPKYNGVGKNFPPHGDYDDGDLHPTLQDLRLTTRYQLLQEVVALSPHLGVTVPMMDYESIGYASAGRHLKQLHLGLAIGRTFEPALPRLYFHLQYEFTLSEKYGETAITEQIGQNRSDLAFQIGWLFDKLELNVAANMRIPHGGIAFADAGAWSMDELMFHDALLKEGFTLVGGGLAYSVTEKIRINVLARFFISGENTRNSNLFGGGVSWDLM